MSSIAKAQALIRDLSDKLSTRLAYSGTSMNTVTQGFTTTPDAAGAFWPYLLISENGNTAEGQPVLYIEISNVDAISKDIFGNDIDAYAPHILQFGYEAGATAGTSFISAADLATCEYECIMTGVEFQLKILANGTAVNQTTVNAATPVVTMDDLYWPTKKV
jgi:hypothetical protein